MKKEKCTACGAELPIRELVFAGQELCCRPCALKKTAPSAGAAASGLKIQDAVDPTICDRCGKDNGAAEWTLFKGLPYCPACLRRVRGRRIWPAVLGTLAALCVISLVVWGVIHMRTLAEAREITDRAIQNYMTEKNADLPKKVEDSLQIARGAYMLAPGDKRVNSFYSYFSGMKAMYAGDNQKATACFEAVDPQSDPGIWSNEEVWALRYNRRNAKMNLAFEQKRYEDALDLAREALKENPADPLLMCQVASYCAAVWASRGDYKMKNQAQLYIDKVKSFEKDVTGAERKQMDYQVARIQHRIATKQILTRKEYEDKFGPPPQ